MGNRGTAIAAAVLGLALAVLSGCGDRRDGGAPRRSVEPGAQRIVCGSPAVAEIVFALGRGDQVVGVSDYTIHPPEAKAKPAIGGAANPNRERLLVLQPDLLVTQGRNAPLAAFAREYGIRHQTVPLDTLADLHAAIAAIAEALDAVERGAALNDEIRRGLHAVSERVPAGPPKRVLLLFGRAPGALTGLTTVGPGTFLNDMLRVAGGRNIFEDATGPYPQVSKESLLVREPEVILEIHPGGLPEGAIARLRADWREFASVPAVRNGRIHVLTEDFLLMPGPRVVRTAELLADAIHAGEVP